MGQHFEAISDLDMVIRLEPESDAAYNDRGADKAVLDTMKLLYLDAAIRINSKDADNFNRGFSKKRLGRTAEANQDFQKALV